MLCIVSCIYIGASMHAYMIIVFVGVEALSNTVSDIYIQTHLQIDEEAWPPMHPKRFTPLVLIQYKGEHNLKQSTTMAEIIEQGHLDEIAYGTTSDMVPNCKRLKLGSHKALQEIFETSRITKEIVKILTPLEKSNEPQFILIEGAPGIGKSLLLKHIGYLWGKKKIMQKFKLVLLVCLRDPAVQKMSKVNDLLQLFCRRHREAEQVVSTCSDYLTQTNGKDVAFLFDGYDEYPKMLQKDSLIADILKRKVLPNCGLIVSSRPHASVNLRGQATVKADILGFAESEREDYIKEALENQPQKIHELTQYLQNHSIISSLCFVPFNMVVLVYMYKKGNPLPKNSAELYSYFVCLTICRHLIKHGQYLSSNIIKLTDLPEPCYKIVQQLSKLSLEALTDNKLVFTFDEINAACPDITGVNGEINAFGLLHVVEHFELTGVTKTFNFLHFSIQEYLAANYITSLPADEELKIIEKKFWSSSHFNMFSIYIALTMGQRPSFKQFLSGKNKMTAISDDFLNDQLLCLRLYHCFYEAGDDNICKAIQQSKIFNDKEIDLNSVVLEPYDVECITVFLTSSSQNKWMELDMCKCFIQDHGLRILYHGLCRHGDVTINKLWLDNNGLTMQSFFLISEITVKCEVKELGISNNNIIDYQQLYSMLTHPFTSLEILNMQITKLSSEKAISLFNALRDNKKLRTLIVTNNAISDDVSDAIIAALQKNVCLDTLAMNSNPITGEAMEHIVNGAKGNNTLQQLMLPRCPEDIKKRIISLQEHINEMRENQGIQIKLSILFSS